MPEDELSGGGARHSEAESEDVETTRGEGWVWREGWIFNKTPTKVKGTNTVIGIGSALFSVKLQATEAFMELIMFPRV